MTQITLISEPVVIPIFSMAQEPEGVDDLARFLLAYRPECGIDAGKPFYDLRHLLPHDLTDDADRGDIAGNCISDNELLVEVAGRSCYHSWGKKAGRKTNQAYIDNTQKHDPPHRSLGYHPHTTYVFGGISRRMSHELIRNYVGHARDEEGAPSMESTRYTIHNGWYVVPPYIIDGGEGRIEAFRQAMQANYDSYLAFVRDQTDAFDLEHGQPPRGMERKRIQEAASGLLAGQAATMFVWTTNPMAELKLWHERCQEAADREFQRFARRWRDIAVRRAPNLYPPAVVAAVLGAENPDKESR